MQSPSALKLVDWIFISLWRAQNNLIWANFGPNSKLHHNLYAIINLGPGSAISFSLPVSALHRLNSGGLVKFSSVDL